MESDKVYNIRISLTQNHLYKGGRGGEIKAQISRTALLIFENLFFKVENPIQSLDFTLIGPGGIALNTFKNK